MSDSRRYNSKKQYGNHDQRRAQKIQKIRREREQIEDLLEDEEPVNSDEQDVNKKD